MIAVFDTSGKDGSVARKIDSYEILYPANGVKVFSHVAFKAQFSG